MTSVSKRRFGFTSAAVYRRREPHAFKYLSERATFWIAVLSVFAFVTGNMIGQHGWHVFWKSVMGEGTDSMIVFTGMVPPVAQIPNYGKWSALGGDVRTNTFRQVPKDLLVALPRYIHHGEDLTSDPELRRVYFVEHLGTYANGRGKGSHVGTDISLPEGTPIQSIANGIVEKVGNDVGGYGNYVMVRHPNVPDVEHVGELSTIRSIYAHLSVALVTEGTVVQKGDQIALSGKTGYVTAPHLHFQVDQQKAPFHPYWPFNTADERSAKLTFNQAIDQGLNRDKGVQYTLDPMIVVQSYQTFVGPVVAQASSSSVKAKPLTVAQRRDARLAKLGITTTLVAYNQPVALTASTSSASSVSSASSSSSAPVGVGPVKSIRISHDGSYTGDRAWERVTLMLLDADGRVVTKPTGSETLALRTAFGQAEFQPATVSISDFKNGVTTVQMLPFGKKTVVVQVQPMGDLSQPMKYVQ